MAPPKKATTAAAPAAAASTATSGGRKPWIKKSPVDVVLEQITKQEEKVNDMRTELAREERLLAKMQKAKSAFEAD
jgi:hypothetical protein